MTESIRSFSGPLGPHRCLRWGQNNKRYFRFLNRTQRNLMATKQRRRSEKAELSGLRRQLPATIGGKRSGIRRTARCRTSAETTVSDTHMPAVLVASLPSRALPQSGRLRSTLACRFDRKLADGYLLQDRHAMTTVCGIAAAVLCAVVPVSWTPSGAQPRHNRPEESDSSIPYAGSRSTMPTARFAMVRTAKGRVR